MSFNLVSAICILLLLLCCAYGYRVGFLRTVIRLASSVLILAVSGVGSKYLGGVIVNKTSFSDLIYDDIVRRAPLLKFIADPLSEEIIYGVAFLVIVLLTGVLVHATGIIVSLLEKVPVIRGINRILGVIPAAILYFLAIWTIMYVAELSQATKWGAWIMEQMQGSEYLFFLYQRNLLKHFLVGIRGG